MITDTEIEKKFNKLLTNKDLKSLQSVSIFETGPNQYVLFGKYSVKKHTKNQIEVQHLYGDSIHTFFNIRNAICWCINDMRGKFSAATRIISLDRGISNEEVQIDVHRNLFRKAKTTDDKLIFLAKLNEEKLKRRDMYQELESYIRESDYWQQNKFRLKTEH